MAHFAKNSTNYNGARSKTRVADKEGGKKGKKKGYEAGNNQNDSWDSKDSWGGRRSESTKSSNGDAWGDIPTNSASWNNGWEVKSRGKKKGREDSVRDKEMNGSRRESKTLWNDIEQDFPPIASNRAPVSNVWEERLNKFRELKSIEPSNEDEEKRMIRIALELSKQEVVEEERRKRIEEEYLLQEQLLMSNPNEFVEFLLPGEGTGEAGENFSSKTDSSACTVSEDTWCDKEYATAQKNNSAPKATSTNKNSGSWDDYAAVPDQKKYPAPKTSSKHKNTSNWDDSVVQKNHYASNSKQHEGIWDTGTVGDKYSENFKKGNYAESVGNKTHYSNNAVSKDETQSRITKVVNMFGGWGSSSNSTTNKATNSSSGAISSTKSTVKTDKLHPDKVNDKIICEKRQTNLATITHGTFQSQEENVVLDSEKELFYDTVEEPKEVTSKIQLSSGSKFSDTAKSLNGNQNDKEERDQIIDFQVSHHTSSMENRLIRNESNVSPTINQNVSPTINQSESYLLEKQSEQMTTDKKYSMPKVVAAYSLSEETRVTNVASNQNSSFSDKSKCADLSTVTSSFNHSLDLNCSQNNALLQNSDSFKGEPNSVSNIRPVTLIDPPKPASKFLSTESVEHPKLDSFQPELYKSPKLAANFQNTEYIEPPKPASSFQTEYIDPTKPTNLIESEPDPVLQVSDSNMMGGEPPINVAPAMSSFAFPPSELTNMPYFPTNPMMSGFINPNLMGGMNPFLMQPMLMLSNPFLARQLQAMDMYYRAMGMVPTGPQNMLTPQMSGFSAPACGSPAHDVFGNNSADHLVQVPSTENKVINPPIYPSNETQWNQEITRPNFGLPVMNSNVASENSFKPEDDDVDSLLMSFLSKDEPCGSEEICIRPPVPPPIDTKQVSSEIVFSTEVLPQNCNKRENATVSADKIAGYSSSCGSDDRIKGVASSTGASLNATVSSSSSSWDKNDAAQACSVAETTKCTGWGELAETTKCTGWGELDNESSRKTNLNNWNEDVDGWGNDNFTTKSMGNPTHFDSKKKSANRQPSREPNFSRFKR